jgi:hypothetical protein
MSASTTHFFQARIGCSFHNAGLGEYLDAYARNLECCGLLPIHYSGLLDFRKGESVLDVAHLPSTLSLVELFIDLVGIKSCWTHHG